jgi:dopamine beta-monooxygenase
MKLILLSLLISIIFARPYYQPKIPNGNNVYHNGSLWSGVGHYLREGTGARNPFGLDFQKQGYTWTPALCAMDSDKDGQTNGEELGDPNCIWKEGNTPSRTTNITHPGFPANVTGFYDPDCYLDRGSNTSNITLTFPSFNVPSTSTSYYCTSFTLPSDKLYYAIKYHPIINSPHTVHHMILYVCGSPTTKQGTFDCAKMETGCDNILYAWAVGGGDFCLPKDVGIVFGKDEAVNVLLQIHFDNAGQQSNIFDTSGVQITYTSQPQSKPAGFVRLGYKTGSIKIPPGKADYEIVGKCAKKNKRIYYPMIYTLLLMLIICINSEKESGLHKQEAGDR